VLPDSGTPDAWMRRHDMAAAPADEAVAERADTCAMTRDDVLAVCLDLPAAEETYPFGEEVAVMKVGGKMFALVPLSAEPETVNLRCDPARALELREAYPGIRPGYHQNKRHWNTVDLDGSVEDDVVRGLIADSYDLVVAALPRTIRARLAAD
jgi:predicted DNA-binding protein (MmcQ/YjbR family)